MAEALPARFGHARRVLERMVQDANGDPIWRGKLTQTMKELGLHVPAYTDVKGLLEGCDAIRQVKRGGGGQPSEWRIVKYEVTDDELWAAEAVIAAEKGKPAPTQQRVTDLNTRMNELEQKVNILWEELRVRSGNVGGSEALSSLQ